VKPLKEGEIMVIKFNRAHNDVFNISLQDAHANILCNGSSFKKYRVILGGEARKVYIPEKDREW
jgi:hypothetical protein